MYKLIDLENLDTVYVGDCLRDMKAAANKYDDDCDGDWFPLARKTNENGKWESFPNFMF